jgi:aspartate/methionine/tyrosine aminotransferase
MDYRRMPIEIESPEQFGYERIKYNLAESSVTDLKFSSLGLNLEDLVLAYGDHRGKPELRAALATDSNLEPDDVLLTPGAAAALFIIQSSLLEAGSRILVMRPNYATNLETPKAIGAAIDYLDLHFEDGFKLNLNSFERQIKADTKLVSLTNPHNPTGTVMSETDLRAVLEIIEASNAYLLFDETYRDMNFNKIAPLAASLSTRAISVSSMSKSYGLPGIRMGWLICSDKMLQEKFLAAKEQIFIGNSVLDEEVAYQVFLKRETILEPTRAQIRSNFSILRTWMLEQQHLSWIEPSGGVVCFPKISSDIDVKKFYNLLEASGTFVGPGHWFEQSDRVTVTTPDQHFRLGYSWASTSDLELGLKNITLALETAKK